MIESHVNFPSQAVSDLEKLSDEYGLKVAKAIETEWFDDKEWPQFITTFYENQVIDRLELVDINDLTSEINEYKETFYKLVNKEWHWHNKRCEDERFKFVRILIISPYVFF